MATKAIQSPFRTWLIQRKGLSSDSARDVVSRCRRIERILKISLEKELASATGLDRVVQRINRDAATDLRPGASSMFVLSQLRRAAKLFAEYKGGPSL